jgi:phosphatidylglycerophosphate synthase
MLDQALRPVKDRMLTPVVRSPAGRLRPAAYTALSLVAAVAAGVAAWQQLPAIAVVLWLLSRLADGLDGAIARERRIAGDRGGLVDILGDTLGYAVVPLGIAAGIGTDTAWITVAVLQATFFVNTVTWMYPAALLEKRDRGATSTGAGTSTVMPRGLIEGTETIAFFTLALAWPDGAVTVLAVMAAAVAVTAIERSWWAWRTLA